jgi:membrane protease YdiL (CAAX protease family)
MRIFWNPAEERLRALWRIAIHAIGAAGLGLLPIVLIAEPLTMLHRRGLFLPGLQHDAYDRVINMIVGPLLAFAIVASVILAARWLDHRPLRDFGVTIDRKWWMTLGLGFAVGAGLTAFVFGLEYGMGWVRVTGTWRRNVADVSLSLALSFSLVKVLCVGVYEEFVSRGYWLRNISEGLNPAAGAIISSAIFAALHATNENASFLSTAGLFINGLLFVSALRATGRLSCPIGLHISWNLFQGAVFGFPVSGDKEGASLIAIQQLGSTIMTGGDFGPEAGVVGIAASLIGIGLFANLHRRHHNPLSNPARSHPPSSAAAT